MDIINNLIEIELFRVGKYSVTIGIILTVLFIIIITKLLLWLIRKILFRRKNLNKSEGGNLHSLFQIIKYIVWIISILIILDTFGLKLNVLLAGSAALLVGVGLGNSSLDFELLFFSKNIFRIENVKSDIRKIINRKFIENKITIPFPQMYLHFKSNSTNFLD